MARAAAIVVSLAAGCDREARPFRNPQPDAPPATVVREGELRPGPHADTAAAPSPADGNAFAVSEGQRLFAWYNCSGCHANGGGGMGPPLMDDEWIYGSAPANVYATIVEGRPNGMPSFAGRIPPAQVWQLVAYVRSLSALTPSAARSARQDRMMYLPGSQSLQKPARPRTATRPPAGEQP